MLKNADKMPQHKSYIECEIENINEWDESGMKIKMKNQENDKKDKERKLSKL